MLFTRLNEKIKILISCHYSLHYNYARKKLVLSVINLVYNSHTYHLPSPVNFAQHQLYK